MAKCARFFGNKTPFKRVIIIREITRNYSTSTAILHAVVRAACVRMKFKYIHQFSPKIVLEIRYLAPRVRFS